MRDAGRGAGGVEEPELPPNLFVIGLLHNLKAGNYSLRAWAVFWRDSWIRSLQIVRDNPRLRASWLRFVGAGTIGILAASFVCARFIAPRDTIPFLITSLIWWAVLMADLGVHLGLMVNLESGELQRRIGVPNQLTELRAFSSIWVAWGAHWLTQRVAWPLVFVFGLAAVSDLLDGWIARRAHSSTRWGRLYDPFMDGVFFGVAAISLAVIGALAQWVAALVVFRYALPVVGAIAFLLVRRRTLRVRHTPWGRASSASIAATIFLAGAAAGLGLPFDRVSPILYAIVVVAAVGALFTIVMRGVEQV